MRRAANARHRLTDRERRDARARGFGHSSHRRRGRGSPVWYDPEKAVSCTCDDGGSWTTVRNATGYSDFAYFKKRCTRDECDGIRFTYIEG